MPELREALAAYLDRVRGTSARPGDIVICTGYAQGIALVIQELARAGARRLAVEDPSADDDAPRSPARPAWRSSVSRSTRTASGSTRWTARDADAVVLTPSHQWPTGAVLPAERRAAVLRWARERRRARHRGRLRRRVPLRPRARRRHAGPRAGPRGLRRVPPARRSRPGCGWAGSSLPPRPRRRRGRRPRRSPTAARPPSTSSPSPTSWTAASSTATCAGCARVYRRRRDALLAALARAAARARPAGIAAGLHLVAWLPRGARRGGRRRGRRPPRRRGARRRAVPHLARGPPG